MVGNGAGAVGRAAALCAFLAVGTAAQEADVAVPRYRLEAGRKLRYEGTRRIIIGADTFTMSQDEDVWIVRRNPDGSWRQVLFQTIKNGQYRGLAEADVFPDGRTANASVTGFANPEGIWHRLPASPKDCAEGWSDGEQRFRKVSASEAQFCFSHELGEKKSVVTLDLATGFPSRIEYSYDEVSGQRNELTRTLVASDMLDQADVARLGDEVHRFLAAKKDVEYRGARLERIERAFDATRKPLADLMPVLTVPMVREQVDHELKALAQQMAESVKRAQRFKERLDAPAPPWRLTDSEGSERTLELYRGSTVVLVFWHRDCAFCLDALPELSKFASAEPKPKATILGLNTVDSAKDVREVGLALEVRFPLLTDADGVAAEYGIDAYPTLVVVDPEGRIHDYFFGCAPRLGEALRRAIDESEARVRPGARRK